MTGGGRPAAGRPARFGTEAPAREACIWAVSFDLWRLLASSCVCKVFLLLCFGQYMNFPRTREDFLILFKFEVLFLFNLRTNGRKYVCKVLLSLLKKQYTDFEVCRPQLRDFMPVLGKRL